MWWDFRQLWEIASTPDNVPIVALLFLVPFYTWYAFKQAFATDRLIVQLEADPALAKTHHRKVFPWKTGWDREVHVWPYLMRIEFLAAIIVTVVLMIWSITLNAPLEEPANPNLTMNPAKAPWYFLGLQEMLVYFDPWIAGVVMPTLIIIGLMVIPYIDANPLGNGYYTYRQRKFAIWTFLFGFLVLWVTMIVIGTFIRGPGWMWFWPTQTWDHNRLEFAVNRNLDQVFGIDGAWLAHILPSGWKAASPLIARGIFGIFPVGIFVVVSAYFIHWLMMRTDFSRKIYKRMTLLQIITVQAMLIPMVALPVKILLRLVLRVKYVWVTPWFTV
jgi:cytochrome b/b6/petD-like protein